MILVKFFWWATWANRSRSLVCHEWPKQFTHGCSFDMSDLSDSLTVAHLSWVIWANRSQWLIWFERNEQMSDEWMSEFPALHSTAYRRRIKTAEKAKSSLLFEGWNWFSFLRHYFPPGWFWRIGWIEMDGLNKLMIIRFTPYQTTTLPKWM